MHMPPEQWTATVCPHCWQPGLNREPALDRFDCEHCHKRWTGKELAAKGLGQPGRPHTLAMRWPDGSRGISKDQITHTALRVAARYIQDTCNLKIAHWEASPDIVAALKDQAPMVCETNYTSAEPALWILGSPVHTIDPNDHMLSLLSTLRVRVDRSRIIDDYKLESAELESDHRPVTWDPGFFARLAESASVQPPPWLAKRLAERIDRKATAHLERKPQRRKDSGMNSNQESILRSIYKEAMRWSERVDILLRAEKETRSKLWKQITRLKNELRDTYTVEIRFMSPAVEADPHNMSDEDWFRLNLPFVPTEGELIRLTERNPVHPDGVPCALRVDRREVVLDYTDCGQQYTNTVLWCSLQ